MSHEDAAASSFVPPVSSPRSHTSTDQWQSFEMRMRRRRAERCALRAEVALEAGFPDDAREALDEARRLDASIVEFDVLQAQVAERQAALGRDQRARRIRRVSVAAVLLLAVTGTGVWLDALPVPGSRFPVPTSALTRYGGQAEARVPSPHLRADALRWASRVPSPEPRAPREREELPSLPSATVLTHDTLPAVSSPEPPLPSVAQPLNEGPPASVDEGSRVRTALARYEAAYSTLSVSATQELQRLSLGQCTVAIDGAAARAECNGTATWTPKIGGGSRTESRNWRFELKNAGGEWQVVRAEAR